MKHPNRKLGMTMFVVAIFCIQIRPHELFSFQISDEFLRIVEHWESLSNLPYLGERIVDIENIRPGEVAKEQMKYRILVGESGYMSFLEVVNPKEDSTVQAKNTDYCFSLRISSVPVLTSFVSDDDNKNRKLLRPDSLSLYDVRHEDLKLHPGLVMFDSVFDSVTWLELVKSKGFSVSKSEPSGHLGGTRIFFSCKPTEEFSSARMFVPIVENGVLEVSSAQENFLPTRYSFEFRRKMGAQLGKASIEHTYEQMADGKLRVKSTKIEQLYKGKSKTIKRIYENKSTTNPSEREFRLSNFGLKEPNESGSWIKLKHVSVVVLLLLGVGCVKILSSRSR